MPVIRRPNYRRRRITVFGGAALAILLGLYLPFTMLSPVASAEEQTSAVTLTGNTAAALTWPTFGASAVGAVGYPGVLASSGTTKPLPMASISKIITTLVVLQAKPLALHDSGPTVRFTAANAALLAKYLALDGETKPMKAGSTMSELDLLRVSLVASANNYAETLADWAYGSEGAFLSAARAWLDAHKLSHTTLVEPTGINPGNTSTATDLVALGQIALADPVIADIVNTRTLDLPVVGIVHNTNKLLGLDGVLGIKTGTLENAGSDLLFAAKHKVGGQEVMIVGVVLGAADHDALYPAVRSLLTAVQSGFHAVTLATKGQIFAQYSTPWQKPANAIAVKGVKAVVWSDTPIGAVTVKKDLRFAAKGAEAGEVTFTIGATIVHVPLTLDRAIGDPGPWWRLVNPVHR